jgi:hypothetical protein
MIVGDLPLVGAKLAMLRSHLYGLQASEVDTAMLELLPGWQRPPGFPRGELMCVNSDGNRVVRYPVERLLRWMDGQVTRRTLR